MKRLNKIAMRMRKMAKSMQKLSWDNLIGNLTPENWNKFLNGIKNQKIYEYLDLNVGFDAEGKLKNPKMCDGMIRGFEYADDNGLDDTRVDFLIAYSDARKTTDQLGDFGTSLIKIVNVLKGADNKELAELNPDSFAAMAAQSGVMRNTLSLYEKKGISEEEAILHIMSYAIEFFDGNCANNSIYDCVYMELQFDSTYDQMKTYLDLKKSIPLPQGSEKLKQAIREYVGLGKNINDKYFQFVINNYNAVNKPKTNPDKNLGIKLLSDNTPEEEKQAIIDKITTTAKKMAKNKIFTRIAKMFTSNL